MKNLPVPSRDQGVINYQDVIYQIVPENDKEDSVDLHRYFSLLKRKKWVILFPVLIILPITLMNLYIQKPQYESYATLLIEDVNPRVLTTIQDVITVDRTVDFFNTQFEIIKSRSVAEEVVDTLQLHKRANKEEDEIVKKIKFILGTPSRLVSKAKNAITQLIDYTAGSSKPSVVTKGAVPYDPLEIRRQTVIDQFQSALIVKPREGTKLVDIGVRGDNPEDVAKQANIATQVYIRQNLEKKLDVARKAVVWLNKEEATLRERVRNAELALQDFRERNKLVSLDLEERQNIVLQNLSTLNSTYMEAQKQRLELQSRIANLNNLVKNDFDNLENYPDILSNEAIKKLRAKFLESKYEYNNLSKSFTDKHPRMSLIKSQLQETKRQIGEEIRNIINSMQLNLNTLVEKENTTNSALNEQKNHVLDLKNDLITFNSLKHELEITKDLYLTVSKRVREAKLTEALETNNVKIIQQALIPSLPVPSRGTLKLVLGIIAGFGLGTGIAFVSDYLDRRFKSASDIERNLGIPLLGIIPHYKFRKRKDSQLITLLEPWSPASEAYRSIRTWIQLSAPKALQVLLITSAVPHEGKSTTAANLAVTYAQLGRKVLLIDADLRRPTIHRIFNLGNRLGLTDILTGKAHWEETLQNTQIDNLKVLLAGPILPNPAELLSTGQLSQLLHGLKGSFDTIICDSPVQLSIPDVAIIVPDMDGVLLIHCPSRVNKEQVMETKKLLERAGANIVGIVLNNINKKDQQHYYSYYHDYSYSAVNNKVSEVHNTQTYTPPISDISQNQRFITEKVNEVPPPKSFSNVKIEKTSKSHNLSITVYSISYIANHVNDNYLEKNLLSINIVVNNEYDTDYLFSPSLTTLHVVDRTYYEMMYSYSSEMKITNYDNFPLPHNSKNSYKIDSYTSKIKNGLHKEMYIKSKSYEDGTLMFCIPKDVNYYVLTYVNGETRIVVPFDSSL